MTTWTTLGVLDWTTKRFTDAGLDSPRLDAQVLLAHVLACTKVQLYTQFDKPLGEAELARYRELIRRRLAGEPIAYLVGEQEFWSLPLWVDPAVLVPRRDTETLIEVVLSALPDRAAPRRVLDLCTGSGAIAVTLARELAGATVVATDVSAPAAALARRNVERHGLAARIDVREGDLWAALPADEPAFDVVVSNPPYVATGVIATLAPEVRREPVLALDGGVDGLDLVRRLVDGLPARLAPGGLVAIEHGFDQADAVRTLLAPFGEAKTKADLGGQPRVTWLVRAR
ncbi:MAG: peptide chain release factor N(5)-glutamine methyltransferase [Kofleriaceae bacterium]